MIIIDDRGTSGKGERPLENKNQVVGSQTWIYEVPTGLVTRCHYYKGDFTTEELDERGFSVVTYAQEFFGDSYHDKFNMQKLWKEKIRSRNFSEEEWKCLLKDGFLGVLEMNYPELKDNPTFVFCKNVVNRVNELEEKHHGHPFSELLGDVQSHVDASQGEDDKKIWKCIKDAYGDFLVLGEKSSNRQSFHNFYEMKLKQERSREDDEIR